MRTRKTSLIKHKKRQLHYKKNHKRLVEKGIEAEIDKYANAMYRIARYLQNKVKSLEVKLTNLRTDYLISITRNDVLAAMLIYILSRIQDEELSLQINKAELNEIIKGSAENKYLLESKDDSENYYIRAVLKDEIIAEEENKDDSKQSEEKESE